MGLDDKDSEGLYVWTDGRRWIGGDEETTYDRFAEGEPNDYNSDEDCVHMTGDRWNDNNCAASFSVVCEPR